MEIAMLHPVWCHTVDPRLFLDPKPAESRPQFHQILSQKLQDKRLDVDDFAIIRILRPESRSPGADGSPPSSTLIDNTNIVEEPEQTTLDPLLWAPISWKDETETTTPTVANTNRIMQLSEQTTLSSVLFREDETTTPTVTQPEFTTWPNTEFRDLQADVSNLKAENKELKQKVSNLEIDVKSLQRVVFRGA
jgi:hypothetical protein